jgi:protein-L-isoaspartate(D-aspartate) O-methyltransferase
MKSVGQCFAVTCVCFALLFAGPACDRSTPGTRPPGRAVEETDAQGKSDEAAPQASGQTQSDGGKEEKATRGSFEFQERLQERLEMANYQIKARGVRDPDVLNAMRRVPRHEFVPERNRDAAYSDTALPIGEGQTISQPYIVAYMTEKLQIEPGDRVLEIGTGSGYQAAVLSELTSHVYTIEILETLGRQARSRLDRLGYDEVQVKIADGYFGWEEHAPFDAIIVTCAAGHVPPPLKEQLKKGGRMVIPVGGPFWTQRLMLVTRNEKGKFESEDLLPVRFVPMTGEARD